MLPEALKTQGRVLLAIMLREARSSHGKTQAGYLWNLLEPLVHLVGLTAAFMLIKIRTSPLDGGLPIFIATGLAIYFAFRNIYKSTSRAYNADESLLGYPVVHISDIFLARALLELATQVTVSTLLIGGLIVIGWAWIPPDVLKLIAAIVALFAIGFGLGTVIAISAQFFPAIPSFLRLPLRMLYFLSGIFYLPDMFPPVVRDFLWWNPILHAIALFREGYYEAYDSIILDVNYLFAWAIGSLLVAFSVQRAARRALRSLP
jgi:capsular polysaccharide transport system permease protein